MTMKFRKFSLNSNGDFGRLVQNLGYTIRRKGWENSRKEMGVQNEKDFSNI